MTAKRPAKPAAIIDEAAAFRHLKKVHPELHASALPHRGTIASRVEPKRTRDALFARLAKSIVSQQLSGKAADTIYARVQAALGGKVTAAAIAAANDHKLRACGLSAAKIAALRDLSEHILSGKIDLLKLRTMPPEEAVEALVKVRGIGPWTAEMFLIFALGAPDIYSPGDLILARLTEELYKLPKGTKPKELAKLAERWSPHRTFVSLLLWRLHHAREDAKRAAK
jgi:DNA-3-methyladenine glycosylase II